MKKYIIILFLMLGVTYSALAQSEYTIKGRVTDASGMEVIGASVIVKDSKGLGTITDLDGNYSIKVGQYRTLVFSYIGYKNQEVLIRR